MSQAVPAPPGAGGKPISLTHPLLTPPGRSSRRWTTIFAMSLPLFSGLAQRSATLMIVLSTTTGRSGTSGMDVSVLTPSLKALQALAPTWLKARKRNAYRRPAFRPS